MGRRRRSLLDPRGVGSGSSATPSDEGSSEVDWRSQEGSDFDQDLSEPYPPRPPAPSQPLHTPVRFSTSAGPTLVNETPDSGGDRLTPGTLDGLPRRLQMPPPSNYQRANAHPVDAPVAQDLFGEGGYDDFDGANPPTDEFPAQVMEDVGQPYTTPFSVPDAPPIPGIVDRFTPPPAHRTEIGSRRKKPDYLAETPHAKDRYQPTPSPVRRKTQPKSPERERPVKVTPTTNPVDRDEEPAGMPPLALWVGVGGVLFFLVGVLSLVVTLIVVVMSSRTPEADAGEREPVSGGVEIRDNMTETPALMGDPVQPGTEVPKEAPSPTPAPPTPDPKSKVPAVAPEAPRPAPAPQPDTTAPVVNKGLLKIRSNRRVLAYVDNRAIGYTPQDVPVDAGKHRVTAKIPGQPNSEQGRDAVMTEKKMDILVEFSF